MVFLLEIKEKFKDIYNRFGTYIVPGAKLLLALLSFVALGSSIGGVSKLKNPFVSVGMSAISAFLPIGCMIVFLSVFMLIYLYNISVEFALIALCIVLLMYLLYFRFTPKLGAVMIMTVILCWLKLPYVLPVALGLVFSINVVIPTAFGIIIFYIVTIAGGFKVALNGQSVSASMQQISYVVESLFNNKEMILLVAASVAAIALVYFIRRRRIDNSWIYAIVAGTVVQFIIMIAGVLVLDTSLNMIFVIAGTLLGAGVAYICKIVFFSVDYSRTEYVQYEDDEYYYYVKAVPKITIASADVKVKQINARKIRTTDDISDSSDRNAYIYDEEE